jgi:SM-20-related protein
VRSEEDRGVLEPARGEGADAVLGSARSDDVDGGPRPMRSEPPDLLPETTITALGEGEPVVLDGVLGPRLAAQVRVAVLAARARGELRPAGLGRDRTRREQLRSDLIGWIDPTSADPRLAPLLEQFACLQDQLNRDAWLGLRRFEVQLAAYDEGPGYVRHADAFRGGGTRRLTAIYYANLGWSTDDGGALRCWPPSGPRVVEPVEDRMVVFLSERLEHEVAPVRRGPRVAVTAWYWGS